jgi:hypothetical protein
MPDEDETRRAESGDPSAGRNRERRALLGVDGVLSTGDIKDWALRRPLAAAVVLFRDEEWCSELMMPRPCSVLGEMPETELVAAPEPANPAPAVPIDGCGGAGPGAVGERWRTVERAFPEPILCQREGACG